MKIAAGILITSRSSRKVVYSDLENCDSAYHLPDKRELYYYVRALLRICQSQDADRETLTKNPAECVGWGQIICPHPTHSRDIILWISARGAPGVDVI